MGQRRIRIELNEQCSEYDFGTYALIMYYAKQIDDVKAKLLFDATLSEYYYRLAYDKDHKSIDEEDYTAHFNSADLVIVCDFVDNTLIPALNNEDQDLLVKYGHIDGFIDLFYTNMDFLNAIDIYPDEYYNGSPVSAAGWLEDLNSFFKKAISTNTPYIVYPF